ncbi:hypothetical protein E2562_007803, partial [Oryza meyeriana var. granulata]
MTGRPPPPRRRGLRSFYAPVDYLTQNPSPFHSHHKRMEEGNIMYSIKDQVTNTGYRIEVQRRNAYISQGRRMNERARHAGGGRQAGYEEGDGDGGGAV